MSIITNAFTVDVEDYYQVEAFSRHIKRNHWDDYPSHVEENTDEILSLLDDKNIKGTFFTLGCVAEKHPSIVRKIVEGIHEAGERIQGQAGGLAVQTFRRQY